MDLNMKDLFQRLLDTLTPSKKVTQSTMSRSVITLHTQQPTCCSCSNLKSTEEPILTTGCLNIELKKLDPNARLKRAHSTDAGFDISATSYTWHHKYDEYGTGLAVNIPPGYVGLLFPRSSITNKDYMLKNCVGVIDSSYTGEIRFRFQRVTESKDQHYDIGDRIGQLVILKLPNVQFNEVKEFTKLGDRGNSGFGSTGN